MVLLDVTKGYVQTVFCMFGNASHIVLVHVSRLSDSVTKKAQVISNSKIKGSFTSVFQQWTFIFFIFFSVGINNRLQKATCNNLYLSSFQKNLVYCFTTQWTGQSCSQVKLKNVPVCELDGLKVQHSIINSIMLLRNLWERNFGINIGMFYIFIYISLYFNNYIFA